MQVEEIKEYDVYIAFYKSNYAFWSRWIKWWTKSKYSHCEFYVNENLIGISTEQSVRIKEHKIDKEKWDIFKIKLNSDKLKEALIKFYSKTKGAKYDWKGIILAQVFNLRRDNPNKYTCSE